MIASLSGLSRVAARVKKDSLQDRKTNQAFNNVQKSVDYVASVFFSHGINYTSSFDHTNTKSI
jgi:hypothetical protein